MIALALLSSLAAAAAPFVRVEPLAASATSELPDPANFAAPYAIDDDVTTAWVEGKPDEGAGEVLTLKLTPVAGATVVKLVVANGFQKSQALLTQNAAPKRVHVSVSASGKVVGELAATFDKKMGTQEIAVPITVAGAAIDAVALRIDDVTPGSKYKDTCISDVQVLVDAPVDAAVQAKNRAALDAWRDARAFTGSDFAGPRFVERTRSKPQGAAPGCFGVSDAALATLRGFVAHQLGDNSDVAVGVFVPRGSVKLPRGVVSAGAAWATHLDFAHLKPAAGDGRHAKDEGADTEGTTDLLVDKAHHTAMSATWQRRINEKGTSTMSSSGSLSVFDDTGRLLTVVDDAAAHSESPSTGNNSKSLSAALFHWTAAGKIDVVTLVSADCARVVMAPP